MNERKVTHVIKIERSVKIILYLGVFLLGLQSFGPAISIKSAVAELSGGTIGYPFLIDFTCHGCK
jgi:hypothetical protein